MVVVVAGFAAVATLAIVVLLVARSRLTQQRALTAAAEEKATTRDAALAAKTAELGSVSAERAAATALAEERAADLRSAQALVTAETERAVAAEREVTELRAAVAESVGGVDPLVLWILEQARSERTWRFSVAPHPDAESVFAAATNPLLAAIQVELDAVREDVGAVVELDAEIPDGITVAASVLALRATQELLADIVRRSEESTVRVRRDGSDLVIDIDAVDQDGHPVLPNPLPLPPSTAVDITPTGVRLHSAIGPAAEG